MTISLGIDGTGPESNSEYATEFAHSFVRRIWWHSPARQRAYLPGPAMLGGATLGLSQRGYRWLTANRRHGESVLLSGYSRGAAIAVDIARALEADGIQVHAMMLFDCVDRALDIDSTTIPLNVADALHVRRDPAARSRESFSNAGAISRGSGVRHRQTFFMGTHGALGGVPWVQPVGEPRACGRLIDEGGVDGLTTITYERDAECAREGWNWIRPYLVRMGFIRQSGS